MSEPRQKGQRQRGEGWIYGGRPSIPGEHPASQRPSLAGYLCEQCEDALAVRFLGRARGRREEGL